MIRVLAIFVILTGSFFPLSEQVVEIMPPEPRRGDSLKVIFSPDSAVDAGQSLFFLFYLYRENGESSSMLVEADKKQEEWHGALKIGSGISFLKFYIVNREKSILDSTFRIMIRNNNGLPVRNALALAALPYMDEKRDSLLKKELALYPDNYPVWQMYWANQKLLKAFEDFSLKDTVNAFYRNLPDTKPEPDAGLIYLLAHANLLRGEREKYLFYLDKLTRDFPDSPVTLKYLPLFKMMESHFNKPLSTGTDGELAALTFEGIYKRWRNHIISDFPELPAAMNIARDNWDNSDFPVKKLMNIFQKQIKRDPDNPIPYYYLAQLYYYRLNDHVAAWRYIRLSRQKFNMAVKPVYFAPRISRFRTEFEHNLTHFEKYLEDIMSPSGATRRHMKSD